MFQTLASYYKGVQRDAVLYQLLVNFIRNGKELERVKPLLNAYKSKYNLDKTNIETLEKLLQWSISHVLNKLFSVVNLIVIKVHKHVNFYGEAKV